MQDNGVPTYEDILYIKIVKTVYKVPEILIKNIPHPYLRTRILKAVLSILGGSFSG